MKILIFSSCSKTKALKNPHQPTCKELKSKNDRYYFLKVIPEKMLVRDMYRGSLNISIVAAIRQLREFFDVSHYIVSAGFGIINENDEVPPYDCSFTEMNSEQINERAIKLEIPEDYRKIIVNEKPDLIYLSLGRNYLLSLGEWDKDIPCKIIAFASSSSQNVITLPADHVAVSEASRISGLPIHGVVGYKGDLLLLTTRFLKNQKDPVRALREILNSPEEFTYMMNAIWEHG